MYVLHGFTFCLQDFSGEFVNKTVDDADSPLKICRLTSMDEGFGGEDGFLDVMDAEVANLTSGGIENGRPSGMSSLFNAPVLNKNTHSTDQDDDTPVVSYIISENKHIVHKSVKRYMLHVLLRC